jgi:hypothetical protein
MKAELQELGQTYADHIISLTEAAEAGVEDAELEIMESILEVCYRSAWTPYGQDLEPDDVYLLLTTGGPAVRIFGKYEDGTITEPRLQLQDWYTQWENYNDVGLDEALEKYVSYFFLQ